MSVIIDPTEPFSQAFNSNGGFDLEGFGSEANRLNGTEQRDSITGGNLADILSGLGGQDTIEGLGGNDHLLGCGEADTLRGSLGNDTLDGGTDDDLLEGNEGDDLLLGGATGSDTLEGGAGNDTLHGSLSAENINLLGDSATVAQIPNTNINQVQTGLNEVLAAIKALLVANDEADSLSGGAGDDLLIVTDGGNNLSGGTGADTFQFLFSQGIPDSLNRISDFQAGEDSLIIQGVTDNNQASYDPNTGRISLNGEEIIQLDIGLSIDVDDIEFI